MEDNPEFDTVEDTLFVPMLGRIYATENFPEILKDEKALELRNKLPKDIKGQDTQTQYTFLASAVRSANLDRTVADFVKRNPDGVIVEFGCGLETAYHRNRNDNTWYELDLPDVIEYRRKLLGESEKDVCIPGDAFACEWLDRVRSEHPDAPILVISSGVFYYFTMPEILALFDKLKGHGQVEVVFDAINSKGIKMIGHYMKQVGHDDASMYFFFNDAEEFAQRAGGKLVSEDRYYQYTPKKGLKLTTSVSMRVCDRFKIVRMVHLRFD